MHQIGRRKEKDERKIKDTREGGKKRKREVTKEKAGPRCSLASSVTTSIKPPINVTTLTAFINHEHRHG